MKTPQKGHERGAQEQKKGCLGLELTGFLIGSEWYLKLSISVKAQRFRTLRESKSNF